MDLSSDQDAGAHHTRSVIGEVNQDDLRSSLKSLLWYKVGGERSGDELKSAVDQLRSWMPYCLGTQFTTAKSWSLQSMVQAAYLITLSALRRKESRGVHFRSDYPRTDDEAWRIHSTVTKEDID